MVCYNINQENNDTAALDIALLNYIVLFLRISELLIFQAEWLLRGPEGGFHQ